MNIYDDHFTVLEDSLKFNTNINMNNNKIINLRDHVNETDAVNKNYIVTNMGGVHIYGDVDIRGYFRVNDVSFMFNSHIHILFIQIISTAQYYNTADKSEMDIKGHINPLIYSFTHTSHGVHININRTFSVMISHMCLQNARFKRFVIKYKPFAI